PGQAGHAVLKREKMPLFGNQEARLAAEREDREKLLREISQLRIVVEALNKTRADTRVLTNLEREIETLKLEKDRMVETNDRKIRETEHRVGLLRKQQEQDVANAKRETKLEIREGNLRSEERR